jgi:hypothetical protein
MEGEAMPKIIVYVRGGVVQDVISDRGGVRVMIVDYDDEECVARPDRSFQPVRRDKRFFDLTVAAQEM